MNAQLTQWNKMGDHPLVKDITCVEFEYTESASQGAGCIGFKIVYPHSYIVEINDVFVGVIDETTAHKILSKDIKS